MNTKSLFTHAWKYQTFLSELQEDINEAIHESQTAVSSVLKTVARKTLQQFENHVTAIEAEYAPNLGSLQTIRPGNCRTDAETILNTTATSTGYRASVCASTYDNHVRTEIGMAKRYLRRFDDLYSQVQSIVVKSFVGQNTLKTSADIKQRTVEIYELLKGRFEGSKHEVESVSRNLESATTALNNELGNCLNANLNSAKTLYAFFKDIVQICIEFDNTPNPLTANPFISKKMAKLAYSETLAKFHAFVAAEENYTWNI